MTDIFDIFNEIEEKKYNFIDSSFISPILNHNFILVRIAGLIYKFRVKNTEQGWYLLTPINEKNAEIVRTADFLEKEKYLKFFDKIYFIPIFYKNNILYCYPKGNADTRFGANGVTPIFLSDIDMIDVFDIIQARFDGSNYWFEDIDFNSNPIKAEQLRQQLDDFSDIEDFSIKGMTPYEKEAYSFALEIKKQTEGDWDEIVLRKSIEDAGGEFLGYTESLDQFEVNYAVDGVRQPTVRVTKGGHNVISSGICLTNEGSFDLKSLVTVMKERQDLGGDPNRYAWHREWGRNREPDW
jgi:hypothetical protein